MKWEGKPLGIYLAEEHYGEREQIVQRLWGGACRESLRVCSLRKIHLQRSGIPLLGFYQGHPGCCENRLSSGEIENRWSVGRQGEKSTLWWIIGLQAPPVRFPRATGWSTNTEHQGHSAIWLLPPLTPSFSWRPAKGCPAQKLLAKGQVWSWLVRKVEMPAGCIFNHFFSHYLAPVLKCPFKLIVTERSSERNIVTVRSCLLTWGCLTAMGTIALCSRPSDKRILRFNIPTMKKSVHWCLVTEGLWWAMIQPLLYLDSVGEW